MGVAEFKKLIVKKEVIKWLAGIISGILTVCSVSYAYITTKLNDAIDNRIEVHEALQDSLQREDKPFRELLGEALQVPSEVVHYHIGLKLAEVDSLQSNIEDFEEKYMPVIKRQMEITPLYRFLDETGEEFWNGPDGRQYRVMYEGGQAWVVYHGHRRNL
jgi:hypothetical protein